MLWSWAYVRGPGCSGRYEANKAWAKASLYARSLRALCESYWLLPSGLRQANPDGAPHSGHSTDNAPTICRSSPGSFLYSPMLLPPISSALRAHSTVLVEAQGRVERGTGP